MTKRLAKTKEFIMDNELISFLIGVGFLIAYLFFSAATEMGTKLPWKK